MNNQVYNKYGKVLTEEEQYKPRKMDFVDNNGIPLWDKYIIYGDKDGFDLRHYDVLIRNMILPIGTKICRYGNSGGSFTANVGTEYELLSLPYEIGTMQYHEYVVIGELKVDCIVDRGIAAPGFEYPGGGIQFKHHQSIKSCLKTKCLTEDIEWLRKL